MTASLPFNQLIDVTPGEVLDVQIGNERQFYTVPSGVHRLSIQVSGDDVRVNRFEVNGAYSGTDRGTKIIGKATSL